MNVEIDLLRKQIIALQERIAKVDKKQTCVVHFVTNEIIPQSLNINTIYYNKDTTSIGLYDDISKDWLWIDLATTGLTFTDISSFFINGTNTTVVIDAINETIKINASGGLTFADLVNIIQAGDNISIDVDFVNETITINASGGITSIDWSDISNKPTEFTPSSHTHLDSEVELTETYTGNLIGATTVKDAMDILDTFVGGTEYSYITKTLVQADWVLNVVTGYYEQDITLTGILSTSYVEVIAPINRDYYNDYVDNQILLTSVTADTLIFEAIVEPLADIIIEIRYTV